MIFHSKQHRFLEGVCARLREMDDPDPEIITHDSYEWHAANLKGFGTIPKITFTPYGKSTKIKAEIMRSASLADESRRKEVDEIRRKLGFQKARDHEDRILARLFESYWNGYWKTLIRALVRIEQAQKLFTKSNEPISEPIQILIEKSILTPTLNQETAQKPEPAVRKPYTDILAELE